MFKEFRRRLKREAIYQELIRSEYLTLQPPYRSSPIVSYLTISKAQKQTSSPITLRESQAAR